MPRNRGFHSLKSPSTQRDGEEDVIQAGKRKRGRDMEGEIGNVLNMVMSIGIVMVLGLLATVNRAIVMEPKRLRWLLKKQGISGPPPAVLVGNLLHMKKAIDAAKSEAKSNTSINHNCSSVILPFLQKWIEDHVFMFSLGAKTVLHVTESELVKEICTITSWDIGKSSQLQEELAPLLGQGIISSNGAAWALHRRILAPNLYLDKVKGMMDLITDSSVTLINSWDTEIESQGGVQADIEIDGYLRTFSGDVISKACFSKNYSQAENIFSKIRSLEEATAGILAVGIPGMRYIPTKKNREAWGLEKEVHALILKVLKERKEVGYETKDLLQMVIEGAENCGFSSQFAKDKFFVDNCKNIYLAGYGTTAVSASWCLMLLASNPEWQTRVRSEVIQVCKGQLPTSNMLLQMKELTMVIQEALRLYSPVSLLVREALNDLKIGDINVAKGVQIWSYVFRLHTDPEIWGPDSLEFNPQRFANGVLGACKFPHMYMPFGVGSRVCIGQHLAMAELKALISLILANFTFSLSPKYVHSPIVKQLVHPEYGVILTVKRFLILK